MHIIIHKSNNKNIDRIRKAINHVKKAIRALFTIITVPELTTDHGDKMQELWSLSTSCIENYYCKSYRKCKGSICQKCFACAMSDQYDDLNAKLIRNTNLLCNILQDDQLPIVTPPSNFFRFEAFGDLSNINQFVNYTKICFKNPSVKFAIWTKNPFIIDKALKDGLAMKPDNLQIIVSSIYENKVRDVSKYAYFVDHVFTVYTLDYCMENNIDIRTFINCGARSCATCGKCYDPAKEAPFYINEMVKADAKKAIKMGLMQA